MSNVLDGIKPVNQQTPVSPSATRPASAPSNAPASAPVQQQVTAGVVDPSNPATLEVPVQPTPQPVQVESPTPQQPVAAQTPAPVAEPSTPPQATAPVATDPAPAPVEAPVEANSTFFDADWKFSTAIGDTPSDKFLGRMFEQHGIHGESVVQAVYNNSLTDADVRALQDVFGNQYDTMLETVNHVIDQGVQVEAQKVMDAVGGKEVWDAMSAWAVKQNMDATVRANLNAELAAGGMRAQNAARLLKQDFDQYATPEEKAAMGNFVQPTNAPQQAAPQAAPAVNPAAPLIQGDTAVPQVAQQQFEPIRNARELAEISMEAQKDGTYNEDDLALRLKKSIDAGLYKRTAVPTPPPANLMQLKRHNDMMQQFR